MREMKDSGVEWIGEIPEDWNVGKTLYALSMPITDGPHETPELFDDGIPFISAEAVSCGNGHIDFEHIRGFISQEFYEECCKKYIPQINDIYMIKSGATTGKVAKVETQKLFTIWSPLAVFRVEPQRCYYEYLYYFIQSDAYQKQIENKWTYGTQQNIGMRTLEKLMICFPSITQQKLIADYLDTKCSKIDEIIEKQQATIEKLKEYKLSVITEAVTKGINPNVEMKESGIEWIGKIPMKWNVGKTLYALSMPITDGPHETPELFDKGIPFVSAEAVSCGNGVIDFEHIRGYISQEFYEACCKKYVPKINDIYMIKSGATTGKVAIVDTDRKFTIWSPLAVFRCNPDKMNYMYLLYFLQSDVYQKQVQDKWTYGTQQNIGMRSLEKLFVCFPSLDEQRNIADYLNEQCIRIEKNINERKLIIQKLKEYKKSLIYEVVTGKKEV